MELTDLGSRVSIMEALDELAALGTSGAIAGRMRELDIRGGHLSQDCPIYRYLAARVDLPEGARFWVSAVSVDYVTAGGGRSITLPGVVAEFIADHDDHRHVDLCNDDDCDHGH